MSHEVSYPATITHDSARADAPVTVLLPDFPAIICVGNTQDEALSEAQVRLQGMINDMAARGEPIPLPTWGTATGADGLPVTVRVPEAGW